MTESDLKNLLFKLSVQAVYEMSNKTDDPISLQESLQRVCVYRPIVGAVQIYNITNHSDSQKDIIFMFSPYYLYENRSLVFPYDLNDLIWMFKIPEYDYGESETIFKDEHGAIDMVSEEGIVNWLGRSSIDIIKIGESTYDLGTEELYKSVFPTQSE